MFFVILTATTFIAIKIINYERKDVSDFFVGNWSFEYGSKRVLIEVSDNQKCAIEFETLQNDKSFYIGDCHFDRLKNPNTFSLTNIVGYDFNLFSSVKVIDDNKLMMSSFSKLKKAQALTFETPYIFFRVSI